MSQSSSGQPQWHRDPRTQLLYYYDSRSGDYVFQDGSRVRAQDPRSLPSASRASAANVNPNPAGQNFNYGVGLGAPQLPRTTTAGRSNPLQPASAGPSTRPQPASPDPDVEDFANMTLQEGGTRLVPTVWEDASGRYVYVQNPRSEVATTLQTGPSERITDPELLNAGVHARRRLLGSEGEAEKLFKTFRKRDNPRNFFTLGKVFRVLWVDPAGESATIVSSLETTVGKYGERVFSKVRRFVVVREGETYCSALPITSYNQRGRV